MHYVQLLLSAAMPMMMMMITMKIELVITLTINVSLLGMNASAAFTKCLSYYQ